MNWDDERYVRLYTRDTADWLFLPWQARAIWALILRKVDRSGVLATKFGPAAVAVLIGVPAEIVEIGLTALLKDGCLVEHQLGYLVRNYLEAQECPASDAKRQRESRLRRRDITNRDDTTANHAHFTTTADETSRTVTNGHARSREVTPSLSDPNLTKPDPPIPPKGGSFPDSLSDSEVSPGHESPAPARTPPRKPLKKSPRDDATAAELASVAKILERLSEASGVKYQGSDVHTALILGRLRDGISEVELRAVVAYCANHWEGKPEMRQYLRPETLFGPTTIARYLDRARTEYAKEIEAARREATP